MSLILTRGLPVIDKLIEEGIDVICTEDYKYKNKYKKIAILNLMPIKIDTELDLLKRLHKSGVDLLIDFIIISTRKSRRTCNEYTSKFYKTLNDIIETNYDGLIITGAPVEQMEFEEVDYWEELKDIIDYSKVNSKSTLYICWAAQAGLYKDYNIEKYPLNKKCFGVFEHKINKNSKIVNNFDGVFYAPHSRHTTIDINDIKNNSELNLVSYSDEAGAYIITNTRDIYVMGHSEYAKDTLDKEYKRDVEKNIKIEIPINYYPDDDPSNDPVIRWKEHSELLFKNWIENYLI
ncbi:homoserine O-succinyltransferase [Clostridioides mangenotii]|uniref:homoserine O-succinyltransferase n=1 Tax=Metaclostridioides mangenotii TaxID=1540 RepID=UPI001C103F04|nr:homoserine O-succinyltransferase [Clostridioides mangenotii]MBU5306210.1 homoserine O-succinyltransferase [Clostridioides mangenotii]